jgi:peptidoglycan hydrolase CwlO-like protein
MSRTCKKKLLQTTLILTLLLVPFSTNIKAEPVDFFPETQQKLAGLDLKEREILQKLFSQVQEIEAMEKEARGIADEIETVNKEIDGLQRLITEEESNYSKKKESLKKLLQSYQRMGPGSYLEIILKSEDLTDFLRRINTLREITRNTGDLLVQLEKSKKTLALEKTQLNQELASMEQKQAQLTRALTQEQKLRKVLEVDLASLSQEKIQYKGYLSDLEQKWDSLKPFFSKTAAQFTQMIEEGSLPTDAFQISFGLNGLIGSIQDRKLNEVLASYQELPKMVFSFQLDKVELSIPEYSLNLKGIFEIEDGDSLRFKVEEGSFLGMPLKSGAIEDLFREGDMNLSFKSLLNGFNLRYVKLGDRVLELSVGL